MQRAERRAAERESRAVRTLTELDYLLGVSDATRLGALRFRSVAGEEYLAPKVSGVPAIVDLPALMASSERILRNEETDDDLQLIFAPGSSLGGARPEASVVDRKGRLSIAKFARDADEYSIEMWEEVAPRGRPTRDLASRYQHVSRADGKAVLLARRFDRAGATRIPFLSAMSMTGSTDGQAGSYPEIVDALAQHGSDAKADALGLYRRMVFNVMVSDVDDHLRNHGFLWSGRSGWVLSPVYDLNPTPVDLKARILTTNISLTEGICSVDLLIEVAGFFGFDADRATSIIGEVAAATSTWRSVAAEVGATSAEIDRMTSAFEHDDLDRGLRLIA